jgi:acetyltransferase-like isoleucine patch superfamily enzyme
MAWAARDQWHAMRLLRRTAAAFMPPPPRAFASFGEDSFIVPPARVETPECIDIGDRVVIHEHAWLSVQRRDQFPEPSLRIGDGVRIMRFAKIVCCDSVRLGKGVLVADRVYISDVEYLPGDPGDDPSQWRMTDPLPVTIEDGALIGIGSIIKPGVTIGKFAYVGSSSIVEADVPERTLVVGTPARTIRQWQP